MNTDNNYSLHNVDNFKKNLDSDIKEILNKYNDLINEYIKYIFENITIKNKNYLKFIITRGLETIINVFNNLLYYTKNLNISYFHSQKSFYFYVEFIGQISQDQNTFLNLTSRDATIYVYKKTICEINNDYRKKLLTLHKEDLVKLKTVTNYIQLYKITLSKMINDELFLSLDKTEKEEWMDKMYKINQNINQLTITENEYRVLSHLLEHLNKKNVSLEKYLEILSTIMKKNKIEKFIHNIENKLLLEEFDDYLYNKETVKFINWLISD